jgi:tetratricopeptide (TPR) repeat protein
MMNSSPDNLPDDLERSKLEQLLEQLLNNTSPQLANYIRLGAIPHWLDQELAAVLYGEAEEAASILAGLGQFRFISEIAPGQLAYHDQVRAYFLKAWIADNPSRFRQLSQQLAKHYLDRFSQPGQTPQAILPEWIYHLLAANPDIGIIQLSRLFEQTVEARELGLAERLTAVAQERRPLLGTQAAWLDYYAARLALARYEYQTAIATFSVLAQNGHHPTLTAVSQRALGSTLSRQKQWAQSLVQLRQSLELFQHLGDTDNIVRTQLALGDAYQDLADNSGGLYEEQREFTGRLYNTLNLIRYFPFFVYRQLAKYLDFLPHLFGANFQNWIVVRLLRLSARAYEQAADTSSDLDDTQIAVEIQQRLADINLRLGYFRRAEQKYRALSEMSPVRLSQYRTARVRFGLGQAALRRGDRASVSEHLEASLDIFQRFEDWQRVGKVAYQLGQLSETRDRIQAAVEAYTMGIMATTRSQDWLLRTEIAASLRKLMATNHPPGEIDRPQRDQAKAVLRQVDQLAYLARFPGQVQSWFTWLLGVLGGPVWFLMALLLAILLGATFMIIEGEVRIATSDTPVPLTLTAAITLPPTALQPLFALWLRDGLYVLLGLFIVKFLLPITRVEASQPEMYVLNNTHIAKYNSLGKSMINLAWDEIDSVIMGDLCLWRHPNALFSKMFLIAGHRQMVIRGTTNHYRELQQMIEVYRYRHQSNPKPAIQCGLSILDHWWPKVALGVALVLGAILVFSFETGLSLYCATPWVDGKCPEPIKLVLTPWAMWTNVFFIVLFTVGSIVRLIKARFCIRRVVHQSAESA